MIVVISSGALTPQLTFTGTGLADGYGLTVANIQLTRANYIPNGDFELPVVTSSTTIYNGGIVGWVATSMSLSVGTSLNPNWFSGQIANTFSTSNSQFTATCRGMSSNTAYILSFNWGCPIAAGILSSVSANVLFNGNVVGALVCASVGISYQ